ncbi:WD40 repeat-containing protein [Dictyostelium discoideum AX4]|uniref:peptidylprolyl isomerase n=1 Tax=Dictyostelium discoideum TaxID=44689 RepID=Q55F01_DICDI|nr:WD40 repeat-containing protein [Dictyostelium discoideum AX4]EAL73116.1 WD40 repeat-containing protein [Dictyostelium discoideum AX4]|eukprot:XP_646869.1 WD40 repeat-containing protein [Dictyostelium discoideum AX4]
MSENNENEEQLNKKRETSTSNDEDVDKINNKKLKSKTKELPFEQLYLDRLPNSLMYEKSFMHKDICTFIAVSKSDFIVSTDILGYVKFWKKQPIGIEFVKTFKSHVGPVSSLSISFDGQLLCTVGFDKNVRIFDIKNFDLINSFKVPFLPLTCEWVYGVNSSKTLIAISSRESSIINLYDSKSDDTSGKPLHIVELHNKSVHLIKFNQQFQSVISCDIGGSVEYWDIEEPFDQPTNVNFQMKLETDLYDFEKQSTLPISLEISGDGKYLSTMGRDKKIRIFNYKSGKLYRVYDESFAVLQQIQKTEDPIYHLDYADFGRRLAIEKEIDTMYDQFLNNITSKQSPPLNSILFDESNNFLIYSTLVGIKFVNIKTNKVVRVLGKIENSTRFLGLSLYQGKNEGDVTLGTKKRDTENDPTLFCLSFKKQRFYMFTRREPEDNDNPDYGRDVFNEKVTKDEQLLIQNAQRQLPRNAIIHTSLGDIHIMLYPDECPKTVENFTTHSKNNYYNGVIFHRVIKGFMIQTGDPQGTGYGGDSIWKKEFEDEFNRNLRHDRPFTLSMANAGPNTNGSQFFITTVPVTRLDNKHTVFGRVYKGTEVVTAIEKSKTDQDDKPLNDISILNIKITQDVPLEFQNKKI